MKLSPSIDLLRSLNTVLGDGAGAPERAREDGARQRDTVRAILGRFFRSAPTHRREMVILADEVGLGKTYVALASAVSILDAIRRNEAPDDLAARMPAVLVLTPVNEALHNKWIREVSSFRAECAGPPGSLDWIVPAAGECDNLIKLTSAIRGTSKAAPAIVVAKISAFGARLHDVETWRRRALAATFEHCEIPSEERIPWCQMVLGSGSQAREPELRDLSQSGRLWERTEEWASNLRAKYLSVLRRDRHLTDHLLNAAANRKAGALFAALDDLTRSALMACWPTLPLVVMDEVHNLKNAQTAARKNLHRWLAGKASRVLALSATPFQLAHEELSSVLGLRDLAVLPDNRRSALDAQVLDLEAAMRNSRHEGDLFRACWLELGTADQAAVDTGWSAVSGASQADREAMLSRVQPIRVEKALRAALRLQAANQALQKHLGPFVIRHRRDTSHRSYWIGHNAIPGVSTAAAASGFDWAPGAEVDSGSELIHYVFMRMVSLAKDGKGRAALGEELTGSYRHLTQTAANWKKLERSNNPRLLAYKHFLDRIIDRDGADKRHPKIRLTVDRVVEAFRNGHKSMVFCVHTKTAEAVRDEILRCVSRDLEATRDAVFGSKSSFENFSKRFFNRRESLYSLIQDHPLLGRNGSRSEVGVPPYLRLGERSLVDVAQLLAKRGADPRAPKPDRRLILAAVEHVAVLNWQQSHEGREWLDAVLANAPALENAIASGSWLDGRGLLMARGRHEDPHAAKGTSDPLDDDQGADTEWPAPHRTLAMDKAAEAWGAQLRRAAGAAVVMYFQDDVIEADAGYLPLLPQFHARELAKLDLETRRVAGQAFQRILRAEEFLIRYLADAPKLEEERWMDFLLRRYVAPHGHNESLRERVHAYFETLVRSSGRGKEALLDGYRAAAQNRNVVQLVQGGMERDRYFLGFNTPYRPEVLISTSVGQEGIDLHRECRHVIHHDLCWNPATIEQRTGRVDRIGSKVERERAAATDGASPSLDIAVPYLAGTYDERMFNELHRRAQLFEVTMGGDFKVEGRMSESEAQADARRRRQAGIDVEDEDLGSDESGSGSVDMPPSMVEALRVDLAVYRPQTRPEAPADAEFDQVAAEHIEPITYRVAADAPDTPALLPDLARTTDASTDVAEP